jgi:hypothetical protein
LIAASGASTVTNLAVGADGTTLVANSASATGMAWAGNQAAGKNALINGAMDIWQRGTSFTLTSGSSIYTADRWAVFAEGATQTAAQSTSVPSATVAKYSLQITGATSATNLYINQKIESANVAQYKGVITFSWYLYNNTGASITPQYRIDTPTAPDNWASANVGTPTNLQACANGAWTRISATVDVSGYTGINNGLQVTLMGLALNSNSKIINITGCQIELSPIATSFARNASTLQGELAACQRYFVKSYNQADAPGTATAAGGKSVLVTASSVTNVTFAVQYPVTMRTTPTVTYYSGQGTSGTFSTNYSGTNSTGAINVNNSGTSGWTGENTSTATNLMMFHYKADAEL